MPGKAKIKIKKANFFLFENRYFILYRNKRAVETHR